MPTPFDYYNDPAQHGSYQFVTLKEILDGMEYLAMDNASYLKGTPRTTFLFHAKNGIKELTRTAAHETILIELTVGPNSCIVLPHDYVDYVRVSLITPDRRLMPLDINRRINIATGYLQDHNYEVLFDNAGQILTADSSNAYNFPYRRYEFVNVGGQAGLDTAKLSRWGEFNVDERRGNMVFSEDLINHEIVLEYLSDGLQWEVYEEKDIKVHKYIEEALRDYIYEACIAYRQTVPMSEKRRARDRYKSSRHRANKSRSDLNLYEINRLLRTNTMNP
jgi:hypothetical protein